MAFNFIKPLFAQLPNCSNDRQVLIHLSRLSLDELKELYEENNKLSECRGLKCCGLECYHSYSRPRSLYDLQGSPSDQLQKFWRCPCHCRRNIRLIVKAIHAKESEEEERRALEKYCTEEETS